MKSAEIAEKILAIFGLSMFLLAIWYLGVIQCEVILYPNNLSAVSKLMNAMPFIFFVLFFLIGGAAYTYGNGFTREKISISFVFALAFIAMVSLIISNMLSVKFGLYLLAVLLVINAISFYFLRSQYQSLKGDKGLSDNNRMTYIVFVMALALLFALEVYWGGNFLIKKQVTQKIAELKQITRTTKIKDNEIIIPVKSVQAGRKLVSFLRFEYYDKYHSQGWYAPGNTHIIVSDSLCELHIYKDSMDVGLWAQVYNKKVKLIGLK